MGSRRISRECAMQILYAVDVCKLTKAEAEKSFWQTKDYEKGIVAFAQELIDGTIANLNEINELLKQTAENWDIDRMASVDRAILRLASYELLYALSTPPNAVINEAIELAKDFSTDESGKFVNGILDKIKAKRKIK
ncbi:MAG: transcription antitermination factor NusB [Elusimicrobia bacterium CG06_land_8_20_14_3_00_38_11]|nr:MAG: transcription antitermination factor NusB [Elusimicrobia bacterium CG06_land_8_20_14_3_00_38_11]